MQRLKPQYIRIIGITLASLFVLLLIGGYIIYSKREVLLQKAIASAKAKAKREYNLDLKIGSARFSGLTTVAFTDITIVPQDRDSLLAIKKFSVSVKIFPLIFGTIKLADVNLEDGFLRLTDIKGVKNFDFLFKRKRDTTSTKKTDLAELSNNLINDVLYKIPDNLGMKNFLVSFADDSTQLKMLTQTAVINDGSLTSTLKINDTTTWHFAGTMHPSDKNIDVSLFADGKGKKVELPYIQKKFKLRVNFDTITTRLTSVKHSDGETKIFGYWSVRNLVINHPGISSTDIVIPSGSIDANVFVGENYVSVDSSSVIHLKKITAHPFVKYTLRPDKIYELKLNTGWLNAKDIFESFPSGMFESLEGIQVAGKLNYNLNFLLNTKNPDAVQFDSRLDKDGFRVVKYGKTDLTKLNNVFTYVPYEKGKAMAPHIIGPQNPEYTPLDQISPNLRNAVMTAEDPTFYKNRGFVEESIRKSIATDFKEKKFKRGGSTISMQLVKNSFLSRQKTLVRKIEEILIVWMIENNNIMTKNRMLEVYFNIIEWGPNIYGIGEAARYYFGKSPSELTLGESIYLASIVPKPKAGLYAFLPDGSLRPGLVNYFNSLGRLMAGQYLTQRDTSTAYGFYDVHLKESMRRQVAPVDSAAAEKILNAPTDDDLPMPIAIEADKKPGFFQRLFGKRDSSTQKLEQQLKDEAKLKEQLIDTAGKSKKQIRQEKRDLKRQEKERRKELKDKGLL